jgi:hypothetical protein
VLEAYFAKLNPEQRRAVKYWTQASNAPSASPWLAIAGAGSGKTTRSLIRWHICPLHAVEARAPCGKREPDPCDLDGELESKSSVFGIARREPWAIRSFGAGH